MTKWDYLFEAHSKLRRLERAYRNSGTLTDLTRLMRERVRQNIYEIDASPLLTADYQSYIRLLRGEMEDMVKPLPVSKIPRQRRGKRSKPEFTYGTINDRGKQLGIIIRDASIISNSRNSLYVDLFNGPLPDEGKYGFAIISLAFYNSGTAFQQIAMNRWGRPPVPIEDTSPGTSPHPYVKPRRHFTGGDIPFANADEFLSALRTDLKLIQKAP